MGSSGILDNSALSAGVSQPTQSATGYLDIVNMSSFSLAEKTLLENGISIHIEGDFAVLDYPVPQVNAVKELLSPFSSSFKWINSSFSFDPLLLYHSMNSMINGLPLVPSEIADAYDFNWAYYHGYYGNGTTIGIIDAYGDPSLLYDVSVFDNLTHLPPIKLSITGSAGNVNYSSQAIKNWSVETAMDVEWAHAMAPGAKIRLVISPDASTGLEAALSNMVSNRLANVISLSWGTPEDSVVNSGEMAIFHDIYAQAAKNNITIVSASGDYGAYDGTSHLEVNYPASDPYVTAVGGTSLYYGQNGYQQQAWGGTLDGSSFGSGGGFSSYFPVPYWQASAINSQRRGVPDIALDGNPGTGVEVVARGGTYNAGGTSLGTPIFAAIVSLMDQFNNVSLGNVNPMLYSIYDNTSLYNYSFTQIISGNNGYYSAYGGWNPVTGIGSPRVSNLMNTSKQLREAYGTNVMFSGTNYNGTAVSANLTLSVSPENESGNGSTFYYVGFGDYSGNYYRAGIEESQLGLNILVSSSENGVKFSQYGGISSPGSGNFTIQAGYSGYSFSGGQSGNLIQNTLLFSTYGSMFPEIGVEQLNSSGNLTRIPGSSFSGISFGNLGIYNGTQGIEVQRLSPYGQSYDSIFPVFSNATIIFHTSGGHYKTPVSNQTTGILFNVSQSDPYEFHFYLSNGSASAAWLDNGTPINSNIALSAGMHNITATIGSENITRLIDVTNLHYLNVTLTDGTDYASSGVVTLDYFYKTDVKFVNTTNLSFLLPDAQIYLSVSANGYQPQSFELAPGTSNFSLGIKANPDSLNIFASIAKLNATVMGNELRYESGYYYGSFTPGTYNIEINGTGILNQTLTLNLEPGRNYTISVLPLPSRNYHPLFGFVYDSYYSFALGNVTVVSSNLLSYSNSSGLFYMVLPNGTQTLELSRALYQNKSVEAYANGSSSITVNLSASGNYTSLLKLSTYFIHIDSILPLFFYYYYVSWSLNFNNVAFYRILYSPTNNFSSSNYVVEPASAHSALIPVNFGSVNEYFMILVFGTDGSFISSTGFIHGTYLSLIPLLVNGSIFFLIAVYLVFMVKFFKKGKRKNEMDLEKEFKDDSGKKS